MSILLIRHGETDGNKLGVVQLPEVPLNESGKAQAERLGRRVAAAGIRRILSSDLERARMTAAAVSRSTGIEIQLEPLLQERNLGDLRGRAYASFDFDPMAPGYTPPGGESWPDFDDRVRAAWERVAAASGDVDGNLAVVTHGLVCRSLSEHHLHFEPPLERPERWGNTSLTEIEGEPPWRVTRLNCTAHLGGEVVDDTSTRSGW